MIASDGLFDKFTSQQAVDFMRKEMAEYRHGIYSFDLLASQIAHESIFVKGVRDNTTVIVVNLQREVLRK